MKNRIEKKCEEQTFQQRWKLKNKNELLKFEKLTESKLCNGFEEIET